MLNDSDREHGETEKKREHDFVSYSKVDETFASTAFANRFEIKSKQANSCLFRLTKMYVEVMMVGNHYNYEVGHAWVGSGGKHVLRNRVHGNMIISGVA